MAVSTSAETVAARVMQLIGLGDRADLQTFNGRIAARDEIDARMADWCGARTLDEVLEAFEEAEAAAAPVLRHGRRRWPTRTTPRADASSTSTAWRCRASSRASRPRPAQLRWAGRGLGARRPGPLGRNRP